MATTSGRDTRLAEAVEQAIALIPNQRDREITEHRFGLNGKRDTLNEVGLRCGLTRERIRQVEKATLSALCGTLASEPVPAITAAIAEITATLDEMGKAASVGALTGKLMEDTVANRGIVMLLAELSPHLVVMPGNAAYFASIVHSDTLDKRAVRRQIDSLVAALQKRGRPVTIGEWKELTDIEGTTQEVVAIASLSKDIIQRGDQWGLPGWAVINPHNIRDLAYVMLCSTGKPMHFSAIADAVNSGGLGKSTFSQKVVHNGLIKDARFVLIGRGTYALAEWGYKKGSLPDVIAGVLREESPLSSDEIVRRVMQVRQLQDRTIRLSLHTRPQFKRVSKAQYVLDEGYQRASVK